MFQKILIANRGAIACRIIRTLKEMNIQSVAVYSDPDRESLHVLQADEAICLHGNLASETYLDIDKILAAAKQVGAQAIHPGYGFLSENTVFARRCEAEGIAFIGPTAEQIEQFGLKHTARELAQKNHVPLIPGSGLLIDLDDAMATANTIGFPIMLKSTAGGGGIGMQVCGDEAELIEAFDSVKRLSQNNFGNDGVFLEKFIQHSRHIEVQIVGDGQGHIVTLGERDCSLQRRNQKVIEETPAPNLDVSIRDEMIAAAYRLAKAVNYRSAGTIEYIYDVEAETFYFLEMNTRLQVEHGVTEMVTGVDLVRWMIEVAAGQAKALLSYQHKPQGHAIQARLYAEDPGKNFQPSSGVLTAVQFPESCRCDTYIEAGLVVPAFYDPMLGKVIAYADDRTAALQQLRAGLQQTLVEGIVTNNHYLQEVLNTEAMQEAGFTTGFLNQFEYAGTGIDVLKPGTQTTIQDYPGRTGLWHVGVPPSGPMDNLAFQLGNQLLGNDQAAAGLEITLTGPTLQFRCDTVIVLTGATMAATIDGQAIPFWQAIAVTAGSVLALGNLSASGMRTYLCVKGGLGIRDYLGSKSTFTLGQFGGHGGRALTVGDVLPMAPAKLDGHEKTIAATAIPSYTQHWNIAVIYGPHGAPDFFTEDDIRTFFATDWQVHFNSSRTGVRLIGPKPEWARTDGGEAGLHPSNIHDNAYAIGAVDFTGDMPVILGPDGPSLGGFVCPVTIIKADLWKLGQLKPDDKITFTPVSCEEAEQQEKMQQAWIKNLSVEDQTRAPEISANHSPILRIMDATATDPKIVYRISGDDNVLIEYGEQELDLRLRFRAHALMLWLEKQKESGAVTGILELTPGIRSLQVHFDNLVLPRQQLLALLEQGQSELGDIHSMTVPTRTVYLPLSWDDPSTQVAIEKYMTTVNPDAPWCPSNIEFIRRINGLDTIEEVKQIVYDASYLVMGLGDVYLGAPVATPLDPRHRLVTTKYNPARTWTPENAVGIGGAYMCIYGMEGPGGYQFVGRTVQVWNRHRQTEDFNQPWLLRFFDQIRFYEVSHDELEEMRKDFLLGRFSLRVEESEFSLAQYEQFLEDNSHDIDQFRTQQRQAFAQERDRWKEQGLNFDALETVVEAHTDDRQLGENEEAVFSNVPGSLWKLLVEPNNAVKQGDTLAIIESMKMEFPITAEVDGVVKSVLVKEGQQLSAGQMMLTIEV
jgi:urea carboxylase